MHLSFFTVWVLLLAILLFLRRYTSPSNQIILSSTAWFMFGIGLSRFFFWEPMLVQGQSMLPTLSENRVILVDKYTYGVSVPVFHWNIFGRLPSRGDVVVFRGPDGDNWVKRVSGVPGDRIFLVSSVGWFRNTDFLAPPSHQSDPSIPPTWLSIAGRPEPDINGRPVWSWEVPPDSFFLLGDNLLHSVDSRQIGPVDEFRLSGKVAL